APHPGRNQASKQRDPLFDVVLEVSSRLGDTFTHVGQRGKMNTGFDVVLACDASYKSPIAGVTLIERNVARNCLAGSPRQVIEDDEMLAAFEQQLYGDAANVPGATCDEDHRSLPLRLCVFATLR